MERGGGEKFDVMVDWLALGTSCWHKCVASFCESCHSLFHLSHSIHITTPLLCSTHTHKRLFPGKVSSDGAHGGMVLSSFDIDIGCQFQSGIVSESVPPRACSTGKYTLRSRLRSVFVATYTAGISKSWYGLLASWALSLWWFMSYFNYWLYSQYDALVCYLWVCPGDRLMITTCK